MPSKSTRKNRLNAKKQRRQSRRGGGCSDNRCVQLMDGRWIDHCWQASKHNSMELRCSNCMCRIMNIRP